MQYLAPSQRVLAVSMHLVSSHMVLDVLGVAFCRGLDNSYNAIGGAMGSPRSAQEASDVVCVVVGNGVDDATHPALRLRGRHTSAWPGWWWLLMR